MVCTAPTGTVTGGTTTTTTTVVNGQLTQTPVTTQPPPAVTIRPPAIQYIPSVPQITLAATADNWCSLVAGNSGISQGFFGQNPISLATSQIGAFGNSGLQQIMQNLAPWLIGMLGNGNQIQASPLTQFGQIQTGQTLFPQTNPISLFGQNNFGSQFGQPNPVSLFGQNNFSSLFGQNNSGSLFGQNTGYNWNSGSSFMTPYNQLPGCFQRQQMNWQRPCVQWQAPATPSVAVAPVVTTTTTTVTNTPERLVGNPADYPATHGRTLQTSNGRRYSV